MIPDGTDAVDLFAGPGGWDLGAYAAGLTTIGVENDPAAVATRLEVGLPTIDADVATLDPTEFADLDGLIASPPCPAFSQAGDRDGIDHLPALIAAIHAHDWDALRHLDPTIWLPLEVGRWIAGVAPRWVACEQVPPALDLWRAYEPWLRASGYNVWTGVVNAADYGVPQVRKRAILLATLDGPAHPPHRTHAENPGLFGEAPWISMADALGWGLPAEPAPVVMTARNRQTGHDVLIGSSWRREWFCRQRIAGNWLDRTDPPKALNTGRDWKPGGTRDDAQTIPVDQPCPTIDGGHGGASRFHWVFDRPATTIAGDPRVFSPGGHMANDGDNSTQIGRSDFAITVTEDEAATLQSFPVGYPWQGTKTKRFQQIGNAVPPLLAYHLLTAITGATARLEEAAS